MLCSPPRERRYGVVPLLLAVLLSSSLQGCSYFSKDLSVDFAVKPEPDPVCMVCANEILVSCVVQKMTDAEKIATDVKAKELFEKAYGELTADEFQKLIEKLPPADLQLQLSKYSRKCFPDCVGKCREKGLCSDVMYDYYAGEPLPSAFVTPQIDLRALEDSAVDASPPPANVVNPESLEPNAAKAAEETAEAQRLAELEDAEDDELVAQHIAAMKAKVAQRVAAEGATEGATVVPGPPGAPLGSVPAPKAATAPATPPAAPVVAAPAVPAPGAPLGSMPAPSAAAPLGATASFVDAQGRTAAVEKLARRLT